jgi:hypothetical protein
MGSALPGKLARSEFSRLLKNQPFGIENRTNKKQIY